MWVLLKCFKLFFSTTCWVWWTDLHRIYMWQLLNIETVAVVVAVEVAVEVAAAVEAGYYTGYWCTPAVDLAGHSRWSKWCENWLLAGSPVCGNRNNSHFCVCLGCESNVDNINKPSHQISLKRYWRKLLKPHQVVLGNILNRESWLNWNWYE